MSLTTSRSLPRAIMTSTAVVGSLAVLGLGAATSQDRLERSIAKALDGAPQVTVAAAAGGQPRDGSEEFWLAGERPAALVQTATPAPIALGDRVTITSRGRERVLEVVEVKPLPAGETRVESGAVGPALLLVTCREPGADANRPTVRFVVEDGNAAPRRSPNRAL